MSKLDPFISKDCNSYLTALKLEKAHDQDSNILEMDVICKCYNCTISPKTVYLRPEYTASQKQQYPHATAQKFFWKWRVAV